MTAVPPTPPDADADARPVAEDDAPEMTDAEILQHLQQAVDDVNAGRTRPAREWLTDLRAALTPADADARPVAALMRELADAATDGRVTVHADTVRAWADEIERMRELLTDMPEWISWYLSDDAGGMAALCDKYGSRTQAIAALKKKADAISAALNGEAAHTRTDEVERLRNAMTRIADEAEARADHLSDDFYGNWFYDDFMKPAKDLRDALTRD